MTKTNLLDKYPVLSLEISKDETTYANVDEIISYFKTKIDTHPVAAYIAIFDHFSHTQSLEDSTISEDIKDAKNIIFCFGKQIPNPKILAARPRSIGVTETDGGFHIAFMEAPNEQLSLVMQEWVKALKNK